MSNVSGEKVTMRNKFEMSEHCTYRPEDLSNAGFVHYNQSLFVFSGSLEVAMTLGGSRKACRLPEYKK
jgi:hypothetical protein